MAQQLAMHRNDNASGKIWNSHDISDYQTVIFLMIRCMLYP